MPNFDKLLSQSLWEKVVYALVGYVSATTFENVAAGRIDMNVPPEAYGAAGVLASEMVLSGSMKTYSQVGSGFHALEHLLARFELDETLFNLGSA